MTEIDGNRPLCKCHGFPMFWHKDKKVFKQGFWECNIKKIESQKKYNQSKKGKWTAKVYKNSQKGENARKRYDDSDKGKERKMKYDQSDIGKERKIKYENSPRGYVARRKRILNIRRERIINQLEELENG